MHPGNLPADQAQALLGTALDREHNLLDLLRRPGITFDVVTAVAAVARPDVNVSRETVAADLGVAPDAELMKQVIDKVIDRVVDQVIEQVEIATKYAGYIDKQQDEVARAAQYEHLPLPADLDYDAVKALSFEVRQKLAKHRPQTLGQASRVSGVTPAAISLLLVHLKKRRLRAAAPSRSEAA